MNHNHLVDAVLGDMMRAGLITNRDEVEQGIYMAEHEAKYFSGSAREEWE